MALPQSASRTNGLLPLPPSPAPPENSPSPAVRPLVAELLAVTAAIATAESVGTALEAVFAFLQREFGVVALAVEFEAEHGTCFLPYGDAGALLGLMHNAEAAANPAIGVCVWHNADAPPGRMLYALPDISLPDQLCDSLTAQIALRIAHETLARRTRVAEDQADRRVSEASALYDIGQAIDQIELPELLQLITERAASTMGAQACSLMLVDETSGLLRVAASHGLPDEHRRSERLLGDGIAGRVAQTEQPLLLVGDVQEVLGDGVDVQPEIGSSMLVPTKNQEGRVLGVLCIRRRRPAPDFTSQDLKLFSAMATQAALALTNVGLYADLKRRAGELQKISTLSHALLSTLDLETLLARIADDICALVGFERCCIFLREPRRSAFVPRVWRGYGDSIGRNPVREGEGAIGIVARDKTLLHFDARHAVSPERERQRAYLQCKGFARSLGTSAFVAVPLQTGQEKCLGVVVADNRSRRDPISPEQQSLLSAFVNQAGIALENARLVEEMQENYYNIRRLKSYADSVFQSIGAGILSTDGRGVVARWNRAALETLDTSSSLLRETLLTDLIARLALPAGEQTHLQELIRHVQQTGERVQRHKLTLHPDNRPPLTLNLMLSRLPEHSQESGGVVLIFEDVTQEARLESELEKMRRLADIGQLAAKMAHEVRNALSPIKGAAQIIRTDLEIAGENTEWPDIIVAEVDNLSRLTSEMLNFARPTPLVVRELDVPEFLQGAVRSLAAFLDEHQATVAWELNQNLPPLVADPHQLGQVVRNLVINAAQAMPDGGAIRLQADHDSAAETLVLRFFDSGVGIAPEELERVFRPFVTTKPKGTGLGLPIVQKIIDHHGGRVEVASQPGRGTCFTVVLPLHPSSDPAGFGPESAPLISGRTGGGFPDN